jgi:signal transduction histidine kinase/ligand-binding sensor domain-containing protein
VRIEQFSVEQGLSQTTVLCVLQDDKGFLWFGTEDGLNKYDGYSSTIYKHDPDDAREEWGSLSDNWVQAIYQDRAGMLWVGTLDGGLDRLDPRTNRFQRHAHDPQDAGSLSSNSVTAIAEDGTGMLWVGTSKGLDRRAPGAAAFEHLIPANVITALTVDDEGTLWVGTDGEGLKRYDWEAGAFVDYAHDPGDTNSLSHDSIRAIYQDDEGVLWIGTDGGLDRLDRKSGRFDHYRHDPDSPQGMRHDPVRAIHQTHPGSLWVGTWGSGLALLDRETGQFTRVEADLSHIWALHQDRSGALWAGTDSHGLARLDVSGSGFVHYTHDPAAGVEMRGGLSDHNVRGIYQEDSGVLWIGSGGGLDRYDPATGEWTHYRHDPQDPHSLSDDSVWAIHADRKGVLWVGTRQGLNRLDPRTGTFTRYRAEPGPNAQGAPTGLSDDFVLPILEDREGTLWIGTFAGGLNRLDPATGQWAHYRHDPGDPDSLSSDSVMSLLEDREGVLWIGTVGGGLDRFDVEHEVFKHYASDPADPRSLSHNLVASIYEDAHGTLWIGTPGGLNRMDRGAPGASARTFAHYRERDGLANDMVYGIVEDEAGFLWLSTNNGLSRFDPRTETFRNYDPSDGLQSSEFNSFAYHKGSDGRIYFGGINGLNAFYPGDVRDNAYVPPVVLTGLTQGGREFELEGALDEVSELTFRWPNNFFEFEFAALSYLYPEKNRYAYMLEGFDGEWVQLGTRRFGRYTNLPGGRYTLRLKGSNNDGVWNETGTAIQVRIMPPVWATWWFRGLLLLLLLAAVGGVYWQRVRRVEARSRELEAQVEQRTAQLRQESEQRAQVERALRQSEMEQAIAAERNRLARDLHDSVTQSLYSLTLLAEAGQRMLAANSGAPELAGNQARLGDIAQQALQEMRLLVYELRPLALESEGLVGALEQRLETVERRAGVQAVVSVQGEIELASDVEEELYRIAQEALNNALKHAKASRVELSIRAAEGAVTLRVSDDGRGFDPASAGEHGGLGLVGMRERADRIGAQLELQSAPGEGTTMTIHCCVANGLPAMTEDGGEPDE